MWIFGPSSFLSFFFILFEYTVHIYIFSPPFFPIHYYYAFSLFSLFTWETLLSDDERN